MALVMACFCGRGRREMAVAMEVGMDLTQPRPCLLHVLGFAPGRAAPHGLMPWRRVLLLLVLYCSDFFSQTSSTSCRA